MCCSVIVFWARKFRQLPMSISEYGSVPSSIVNAQLTSRAHLFRAV
jgi:hypothetical protein